MSLVELSVGKPYPFPITQTEGAAAQFLIKSGSVLQIVLPDISIRELEVLKSGPIKAGFLYEDGAMLLLFQFCFSKKVARPLLTFDAPFDIRLLPADRRELPSIDNAEQRLVFEIHVLDERKIIRALRLITMPPAMTLKFLSVAQDQLAESRSGDSRMRAWLDRDPAELALVTEMWMLGG